MEAFFMVCAGLSTAALIVVAVYLVMALDQLRRTAEQVRRTGMAVEQLALHLDQNVEAVGGVTRKIYEFAGGLQSGWMRAIQLGIGVVSALRDRWSSSKTEAA